MRFLLLALLALPLAAQSFNSSLYVGLRWRMIGPFRGGRTVAADGIPTQPNVFYVAVNNGGVWKTDDAGRTWTPIFDDQPSGSIGALAIAPSNPNIIYVGSGEGLQRPDLATGDGMYKSTDAGKTWEHQGLRDAQQIGAILVDPRDPNRVYVAALGHPYGPNPERGVYRSTDGGKNYSKILYKDVDTGAIALAFDPSNARTIYAVMWAARQGPWENGAWSGPGSGLFKSTDGGDTWRQLANGLPTFEQGLGRIGIGIAPSDPRRIYLTVEAPRLGGIYRSDDAGETFRRTNSEQRVFGRASDFAEVKVHPKNPDIVFSANTSTYRSTDGGKTFTAIKGAPGGDDYHTIWINPLNPEIMLFASDQGAVVTVNGGRTWSSWYNQPTAQFYHVITDNRFPYWVCGGQQESGSACVVSRGDNGAITFRDWRTVGVEEYGYVAPDPLNPGTIYGGKITRYDWATGQVQHIAPEATRSGKYRFLRTAPVIFSPVDPHVLFYAGNVLFKTTSGGHSWDIISPDLSNEKPSVPESVGVYRTPEMANQPRRGVIYTVAPSYKDVSTIWAGTDDGLIHVTRDGGKNWKNVTPPETTSWSKISVMDAGRFDAETAYAAVNRIRVDDQRAHIYRTHDGGKTWKEIVHGLPAEPVNSVREDPMRRGLLFCGTENAVYVSFNDGDDWQPLRLNMPAISIRDLVIHDTDIVVGTHGRGFWILDDIGPLRQLNAQVAAAATHLFRPSAAWRVPRNVNTDTPLPPEEPAGQNPPDGAIIYYSLKSAASGPVVLEILDSGGKLVRRYSSADKPDPIEEDLNVPTYWIRPPRILSAQAGMHRFIWDLHYTPPDVLSHQYPISAIYGDTPRLPLGPWVMPGEYTVRLTAGGQSFTQPITVRMDPRVKTTAAALKQQFDLSMKVHDMIRQDFEALQGLRGLRGQLKGLTPGPMAQAATDLDRKLAALEGSGGFGRGGGGGGGGRGGGGGEPDFTRLNGELASLLALLQGADATPTVPAVEAVNRIQQQLDAQLKRWQAIQTQDVPALNQQLQKAGLPVLK